MVARVRLVVAGLVLLGLCFLCPAGAQVPRPHPLHLALPRGPILAKLDILRPAQPAPVDRQATISFVNQDDPEDLDRGLASLTWYYATSLDGAGRRRVVTYFNEHFDGEYGQ